jgi:hypothetical protein
METNDSETFAIPGGDEKNVSGEVILVEKSTVNKIDASTVTLRQGAAQNVTAGQMIVRQGILGKVNTENLEITQGAVAFTQASQATLNTSHAGVVVANSDVKLDQSAARVLVANGKVTIDQSPMAVLVANTVQVQNSQVVFLIAKNVEGQVKPTFGPQEAIIFGASAGMVTGIILLLASLFRRKKKR